jgi:hypothetical protein
MASSILVDNGITKSFEELSSDELRDILKPISYEQLLREQKEKNEKEINLANKTCYLLYMSIAKQIINLLKNDVTIFGGFPRDIYRRQNASNEFYNYCEGLANELNKDKIDYKILPYTIFTKYYGNSTVNKETYENRIALPSDIDLFMKENDFKKLLDMLKLDYVVESTYVRVSHYISKEYTKYLEHYQLDLSLIKKNLEKYMKYYFEDSNITMFSHFTNVKIDCIILKNVDKIISENPTENPNEIKDNYDEMILDELKPPFNKPDALCNQLLMVYDPYKFGSINFLINPFIIRFYMNKIIKPQNTFFTTGGNYDIQRQIEEIILKEIINRKYTIVGDTIPNKRIMKMLIKKFDINFDLLLKHQLYSWNIYRHYTYNDFLEIKPHQDDVCCICMDGFETDKNDAFKPCKCSSYFHIKCFAEYHKRELDREYNDYSEIYHTESAFYEDENSCVKCPGCREKFIGNFHNFTKMMQSYYKSYDEFI